MSEQDASRGVMFGGVFRRGGVDAGDQAWLAEFVDAALAAHQVSPREQHSTKERADHHG